MIWTRRLALVLGSTGVAVSLSLACYMGGLGLGSALATRRPWQRAPRGYGLLELGAAAWALIFPAVLTGAQALWLQGPSAASAGSTWVLLQLAVAATCLGLPAVLLGATLPALAAATARTEDAVALYAANTAGAVLGVLGSTFLLLPSLGLRTTELLAAGVCASVGLWAISTARPRGQAAPDTRVARVDERPAAPAPRTGSEGLWLALAATGGGVALALEVVWTRIAAMLVGGSVYAFALVLAVFLGGVALGAHLSRRVSDPRHATTALVALGLLALLGSAITRVLPHAMTAAFAVTGPATWVPLQALLLALGMAGAPVASGAVFALAVRGISGDPSRAAGKALAANTLGAMAGSLGAGLWLVPALGLRGTLLLGAWLAVGIGLFGMVQLRRQAMPTAPRSASVRWWGPGAMVGALVATALGSMLPGFSPRHYAPGLFMQLDRFADPSPAAVERYALEGWELLSYADGRSASVAVGQGTDGGTTWLSVNGKVDASDGDDMPTQVLSGALPLAWSLGTTRKAGGGGDTLVVGLASGVTAWAALDAGATALTVVELEPEVVAASRAFEHVNHGVLDDPRTTLAVDDARGWLQRSDRRFDVIISEPSNPWLTGVSNLFTVEYWALTRAHLASDGVMVQWLQLYALPASALRSLVRSFQSVYPDAWLFESISGADALLVSGPTPPEDLAWSPLLDPDGLRRLAGPARLNTDDHPWIEFAAPRWLHRRTGHSNQALLQAAANP